MEHVSYTGHRGTRFNLSALLTCRSWATAGLPVLWGDVVHSQSELDAGRTRKLVKSIEQSAAAQHMASLTIDFASMPATGLKAMFNTFKNLHQLQTLAVAFGRYVRADVVIQDLEALAESIPYALQNLEIKVRVGSFYISDETLSRACSAAISTAARRLKRLSLDLPATSIKMFSPNSWPERYPYLQDLCITIASPEDHSRMSGLVLRNIVCVVRDTNTAINSAKEQGRLPKLRAGSITAVISNRSPRDLSLTDVSTAPSHMDGILHRGFSEAHSKEVAIYPILRVLSRRDIYWAQVFVVHERFKTRNSDFLRPSANTETRLLGTCFIMCR